MIDTNLFNAVAESFIEFTSSPWYLSPMWWTVIVQIITAFLIFWELHFTRKQLSLMRKQMCYENLEKFGLACKELQMNVNACFIKEITDDTDETVNKITTMLWDAVGKFNSKTAMRIISINPELKKIKNNFTEKICKLITSLILKHQLPIKEKFNNEILEWLQKSMEEVDSVLEKHML